MPDKVNRILVDSLLVMLFLGILILPIASMGFVSVRNSGEVAGIFSEAVESMAVESVSSPTQNLYRP